MKEISIGSRIQFLRKEMGLSQKAFADFLNIPQSSISVYENDKISPTVGVLINIARKCNISLDWLFELSICSNTATLGIVGELFYKLIENNEIKMDIEEEISVSINIYNREISQLLKKLDENYKDLESYAISNETYALLREKTISDFKKITKDR